MAALDESGQQVIPSIALEDRLDQLEAEGRDVCEAITQRTRALEDGMMGVPLPDRVENQFSPYLELTWRDLTAPPHIRTEVAEIYMRQTTPLRVQLRDLRWDYDNAYKALLNHTSREAIVESPSPQVNILIKTGTDQYRVYSFENIRRPGTILPEPTTATLAETKALEGGVYIAISPSHKIMEETVVQHIAYQLFLERMVSTSEEGSAEFAKLQMAANVFDLITGLSLHPRKPGELSEEQVLVRDLLRGYSGDDTKN